MSEITVGSLWRHTDGDLARVIDVEPTSVAWRWVRHGGVSETMPEDFARAFTPHVPPLTGEQMAHVLETLAGIMETSNGLYMPPVLRDRAKEFRK